MHLERRGLGQPYEITVRHLLKIDLAASGESAAPRRHQHQPILAEQKPLDVVRQGMLGRKAEIGRAGRNGRGDVRALALLDIDIYIAMV